MTERDGTNDRVATRADVARYAGVSTAVVSYVVNNGPRTVAPSTAERVRRAIELLDYQPNVNAQALRRGTTEMLGLVLSDPTNPFFTEFAAQIGAQAFARGRALMIATTQRGLERERRLVDDLLRRQVDGLVVASAFARPELSMSRTIRRTPIVFVDAPNEIPGFASVGADSRQAAVDAVNHLVTVHQHRRIALVVGGLDRNTVDPREQGWQDALRAAGLEDGPIARAEWSREGGYESGRRLLGGRNPPSAVFVSSDLQAVGLLRAAHERGLRVPEDLAVIAFDGTKEAEFCWPPLSVVAQPVREMAAKAVELALNPGEDTAHHVFAGRLIGRRSCGCSPALGPG